MKANQAKEFEKNDYGVFLNADASSLERFKMYETIVIDAQYFTKRDIELLHQNGTVVYTYLNIGSIENFREYYTTYAELAIGEYEHREEEEWVDVANPDWQKFIGQLSQELYEKGVDGFFIDNCDVYYYDPHESIFEGITAILQNMMTFGKAVIINGGDTYVAEYRERYGAIDQIMTGVNQESVWSSIDFDSGTFCEQTSETRDYFCKYLETCKADVKSILEKFVQSKSKVAKRESQVRSFFGQHFKKKIYVDCKEEIIQIILKSETKQQVNNGLLKLYSDGTVVSHIYKTIQPLISELPGK